MKQEPFAQIRIQNKEEGVVFQILDNNVGAILTKKDMKRMIEVMEYLEKEEK